VPLFSLSTYHEADINNVTKSALSSWRTHRVSSVHGNKRSLSWERNKSNVAETLCYWTLHIVSTATWRITLFSRSSNYACQTSRQSDSWHPISNVSWIEVKHHEASRPTQCFSTGGTWGLEIKNWFSPKEFSYTKTVLHCRQKLLINTTLYPHTWRTILHVLA
jgi:hypothetical protein